MLWLIKFFGTKLGKLAALLMALALFFWAVSTHYISVGVLKCQSAITKAVLDEQRKNSKINAEIRRNSEETVRQLQERNTELFNSFNKSESFNNSESDSACLSASRLRRVNDIRASETGASKSTTINETPLPRP